MYVVYNVCKEGMLYIRDVYGGYQGENKLRDSVVGKAVFV